MYTIHVYVISQYKPKQDRVRKIKLSIQVSIFNTLGLRIVYLSVKENKTNLSVTSKQDRKLVINVIDHSLQIHDSKIVQIVRIRTVSFKVYKEAYVYVYIHTILHLYE